jgi:hypothetical protein
MQKQKYYTKMEMKTATKMFSYCRTNILYIFVDLQLRIYQKIILSTDNFIFTNLILLQAFKHRSI